MDWIQICIFLYVQLITLHASKDDTNINRVIKLLTRKYSGEDSIADAPHDRESENNPEADILYEPEQLPEAEPLAPGDTLIRPKKDDLKSAHKFPHKDNENLVYGNIDNLGITYGKSGFRVLYSGFRKSNDRLLDSTIRQAIQNIHDSNGNEKDSVIIIEMGSYERQSDQGFQQSETISEEENNGGELLDLTMSDKLNSLRRQRATIHIKTNDSASADVVDTASASAADSSDFDKNPGNPFTVHREKYLQNFLWNHFMDGDHLNLNPNAPTFKSPGPNGADLFFGRKWWYFNQDDYLPLKK